jgi:WD40 repeat protein
LWNLAKGRKIAELPGPFLAGVVRFSPDGKLVAVGDSSGRVVLWDASNGERSGPPLAGHGGAVWSLGFAPDGSTLVTSSTDGKLRLWDIANRTLIGVPLPASSMGASLQFLPDGKRVLAAFPSGTGLIWTVDPAAWKAKACSVAHRNLTRAEWAQYLGSRGYGDVCT